MNLKLIRKKKKKEKELFDKIMENNEYIERVNIFLKLRKNDSVNEHLNKLNNAHININDI